MLAPSRAMACARRVGCLSLSQLLLLSVLALSALSLASALHLAPTPDSVKVDGYTMTVDGKPFKVRGVAYSPVPIGESVHVWPHGDYYTADYVYLWHRDLQAIRAAGFNTLRIYAWSQLPTADHEPFLDACHHLGLKVFVTHYVGTSVETPLRTEADRNASIAAFVEQVGRLGDHPAILAWSFGNELNGPWLGFVEELNQAHGCNWDQITCMNKLNATHPCHAAQTCIYTHLFGWLNDALGAARAVTTRPLTSTFADVDMLVGVDNELNKIPRFAGLMGNFDMFAIQLYRGQTFGDYFAQYGAQTTKPLIVGEYGVDAMNDPCGWDENYQSMRPCYNYNSGAPGTQGGADSTPWFKGCTTPRGNWGNTDPCLYPGEVTQSEWDESLTREIHASPALLGGVLMAWHDEYWKNSGTEDHCQTPCPVDKLAECADPTNPLYQTFAMDTGSAKCTYKAHVSCNNWNTSHHDYCGYWLWSAPDQYVNEAWFGVNGVEECPNVQDWSNGGHRLTVLKPRPVLGALRTFFAENEVAVPEPLTCADLMPCWRCAVEKGGVAVAEGRCNYECGMSFGPVASAWGQCAPFTVHGEGLALVGAGAAAVTAIPAACQSDKPRAMAVLSGLTCPEANQLAGSDLAGRTFLPGVHCDSALTIGEGGVVTLDARGDPNAHFVFQSSGALTVGPSTRFVLTNGAKACHVYWSVGGGATIAAGAQFVGQLAADQAVSVGSAATVTGRVLSVGAVTLAQGAVVRLAEDCVIDPQELVVVSSSSTGSVEVPSSTGLVEISSTGVSSSSSSGDYAPPVSSSGAWGSDQDDDLIPDEFTGAASHSSSPLQSLLLVALAAVGLVAARRA